MPVEIVPGLLDFVQEVTCIILELLLAWYLIGKRYYANILKIDESELMVRLIVGCSFCSWVLTHSTGNEVFYHGKKGAGMTFIVVISILMVVLFLKVVDLRHFRRHLGGYLLYMLVILIIELLALCFLKSPLLINYGALFLANVCLWDGHNFIQNFRTDKGLFLAYFNIGIISFLPYTIKDDKY